MDALGGPLTKGPPRSAACDEVFSRRPVRVSSTSQLVATTGLRSVAAALVWHTAEELNTHPFPCRGAAATAKWRRLMFLRPVASARETPGTPLAVVEGSGKGVRPMTVLLVIMTFAVLILIDEVFSHRGVEGRTHPLAEAPTRAPEPVWVAGYLLPEDRHYHRGHTWAQLLESDTALVGVDDFARRLLGPATAAALPAWSRPSRRVW